MKPREALNILLKEELSLDSEIINLKDSDNRILSKDVKSKMDIPPFSVSSMDGFAVRRKDLDKANYLNLIGISPAGDNKNFCLGKNECVKIFTGSKLPLGCDHILLNENAKQLKNFIYPNLDYKQDSSYIRKQGMDFRKGFLIKAPLNLNFKNIPLLSSINAECISVYKKLIVTIIPTGNEILNLGDRVEKNKIYSSSASGIKSLLEKEGSITSILPICRDNIDEISHALTVAKTSDIIITLGGISGGDYDLIRKNYQRLGIKIIIDKISMRPGKPLMIGRFKKKIIFCLPGNPVSSIICSRVFIVPFIQKCFGLISQPFKFRKALLENDIEGTGPREHYMRAVTYQKGINQYVKAFSQQDSSMHSILSQSNALIVQSANTSSRKRGDLVNFIDL